MDLASAALDDEERRRIDALLAEVDQHVRKNMRRNGASGFRTRETDVAVIAEADRMLRHSGWQTTWARLSEPPRFQGGKVRIIGHAMDMAPTDCAYDAHDHITRGDDREGDD